MRCLFPEQRDPIAVDSVYTDLNWAPRGRRPHVALNMVLSADGRASAGGSAAGIGSMVDRTLMTTLRAMADALLVGAGTLRADRIGKGVPDRLIPLRTARGLAPQPLLAVLTSSGNLPFERAAFTEPERIVIFVAQRTAPAAIERLQARAVIHVAGDERPDPARAIAILAREYGVRHILSEGGPTLNHALLTGGLLDELFLTLAPKILAGDDLSLVTGPSLSPAVPLALRSLYEHNGELFLRYGVAPNRAIE